MTARVILGALCLIASGCRERAAVSVADPDNPLETAAVDANLIDNPSASPIGLYEHRHGAGTDALCIVSAGDARNDSMTFGMTAIFGPTLICEGRGTAVHDGATLHLSFAGADCGIDATYDGRSLRMPGRVPSGCAALCGPRASLSGVTVERVGWDQRSAHRLLSRRSAIAGRAPQMLCPPR